MTTLIITIFLLGYLLIATESISKINKASFALLMCVTCWVLYAIGGYAADGLSETLEHYLGEAGTTLFFLMGAMTIVEIVDQHSGFNFVRNLLHTESKRILLWRIGILTFIFSAILDNLTTTIVMIMILRKLISNHNDRIIYASMIVIAANAGGAFSPIGDVTTIMLWNNRMLTATGVIKELFLPSLAAFAIPAIILQYHLQGGIQQPEKDDINNTVTTVSKNHRRVVFLIGVGGLCCVPIFHSITHLPPFIGILLVLSLLWIVTDTFYRHSEKNTKRVVSLLARIDMSTILFFLGILMAVSVLAEIGVLTTIGTWLDTTIHNHYLVTGCIGILSSIVDNVPLVAGSMKMYPIMPTGDMAVDGIFWQLLAYCAGVGGSMLIIGSAAGVVAMGLEKITFGWYMKKITWVAFLGYVAGMAIYWLERTLFFN